MGAGGGGGRTRSSQSGVKQSRVDAAAGGVNVSDRGESTLLWGAVLRRRIAKHQGRSEGSMSLWRSPCQTVVPS